MHIDILFDQLKTSVWIEGIIRWSCYAEMDFPMHRVLLCLNGQFLLNDYAPLSLVTSISRWGSNGVGSSGWVLGITQLSSRPKFSRLVPLSRFCCSSYFFRTHLSWRAGECTLREETPTWSESGGLAEARRGRHASLAIHSMSTRGRAFNCIDQLWLYVWFRRYTYGKILPAFLLYCSRFSRW